MHDDSLSQSYYSYQSQLNDPGTITIQDNSAESY